MFGLWDERHALYQVPASIAVVIPQRHLSGVAPETLFVPAHAEGDILYPKGGHSW